MKKYVKIMAVAAILLSGLMLAGCAAAETIKEIVDSTHNTWYKYKSDKQIDIPVLSASEEDNDSAAESSNKLKDAQIYFYFDSNNGLLVAIQSETKQTVSILNGLYQQEQTLIMGSTKQFTKDQFDTNKWSAFVLGVKLEKTNEPEISAHPDRCIVLGSDQNKPKIQWKKFLANYLLGHLLED